MKTKILTLLLALHLYPLASNAQFNTISGHAPRARITAINDKEASPESDTSHVRLPGAFAPDCVLFQKQSERTSHVSMTYPLHNIKITSPFGYRTDPFTGKRTMHNGIDLAARSAVVYSMLDGTVEKTGYDSRSGNFVTLRHGDLSISYCHLSQILATKGQSVLAGFPVGITGSTGRSTGEHLHITAKYKGKAFNPMALLNILPSSSLAICTTRLEDSVAP
jgi:murein DD-endopeptidase MepM/ murein hydrolase activator NlpD